MNVRIRQLRRAAETRGLNPNVWSGNVEVIVAERKAAARAAVTAKDVK